MIPQVPIQFLGNKRRYLPEIYATVADCSSVIDLFSGSANVSYYLKRKGLRVTSVDFLSFCYHVACGLIENQRMTANPSLRPFTNPSQERFITERFGGKVFLEEDTIFLDILRGDIAHLPWKYVQSLLWAGAGAAIIAKSSFGRFNVGLNNHLTPAKMKKHTARTLESYYRDKVLELSKLVFDGPECKALCLDVLDPQMRELKADAVYIDPPYPTFRRQTKYEYFYHFIETFIEGTPEWKFSERGCIQKERVSKFSKLSQTDEALRGMFENLQQVPRWVLHYASHCRPGLDELKRLILSFGRKIVSVKEFEATFSKSVYSHNKQPTEYLIMAE